MIFGLKYVLKCCLLTPFESMLPNDDVSSFNNSARPEHDRSRSSLSIDTLSSGC